MSNPKPVEGALTVEQVHKAVKETQQPWSSVSPSYYAVTNVPALTAKLNAMLEAALSAAPAPTERNLTDHQKAVEEAAGMSLDWGMANAAEVVAAAPARDGVRAYKMATAAEVEVATICGHLESGKYRIEVVKALEKRFAAALAAAKEQADGGLENA